MKKSVRNSILTVLCAAAVISASSCATGITYPLTIDGEQIRAGIYILEQQEAVNDAVEKLNEEQPDLDTSAEGFSYLDQTVEGRKFADWVNDHTTELCREYIAVSRLFDSNGLALEADTITNINDNTKSLWTEENQYAMYLYGVNVVGEYYESLGIGEQSYKDFRINSSKRDELFDYYYGEEGIQTATQEELNAGLQSDYAMVNYVEYQLENGSGAQSYADKITSGSTFEQMWQELTQAYNNEQFEKEQAEAAAAAQTEDTAEGTEGTSEETTESTESTESTDTAEAAAEETPAEPEQAELPETDSLIEVIAKDSTSPSEDFVVQVMDMNVGDVKVITTEDGSTYIVQKLDILSKPELTESEVSELRTSLKEDEFEDMLRTTGAGYALTEDSSRSMYKVDKLLG